MSFAKDLRASVLQAAMQGKLTEQLETDTPASELLSKMNIKSKFNEDGTAPDSWQWVEMQDIVKLERGTKTENQKLPYLEARYLRTGNDAKMYTSGEFVAKGTNVILVDGENSGEVFLVPEDGYMGSTFKALSINSEMDKDFILNILLFYKDMFRQSKKGSAIPHLNKKLFNELMVAVPPIEEQKRIVQRIDEIMTLIDELEAIENELTRLKAAFPRDMKAAVLQAAMQGKLTEQLETDGSVDELLAKINAEREQLIKEGKIKKPKAHQNDNFVALDDAPFDIPSSWKWTTLGHLGIFTRGSGIKRDETAEEGLPCVRYGQLYTTYHERFSDVKSKTSKRVYDKCHKIKKNDIVMALTGENNCDIALASVYTGDEIVAIGGDMTKYESIIVNSMYLMYVINSAHGISFKRNYAKGNIIVHISNDNLSLIPIPLPSIEEQHRIVGKLETILPLIEDI